MTWEFQAKRTKNLQLKKNYGKEDERLTHVRGMRAWPLR